MSKLQILASSDSADGSKSLANGDTRRALVELGDEELRSQFARALASVTSMLDEAPDSGPLRVKEVTLKFEITTKGELRLIASAGIEAKGAIEVKLAKP